MLLFATPFDCFFLSGGGREVLPVLWSVVASFLFLWEQGVSPVKIKTALSGQGKPVLFEQPRPLMPLVSFWLGFQIAPHLTFVSGTVVYSPTFATIQPLAKKIVHPWYAT